MRDSAPNAERLFVVDRENIQEYRVNENQLELSN